MPFRKKPSPIFSLKPGNKDRDGNAANPSVRKSNVIERRKASFLFPPSFLSLVFFSALLSTSFFFLGTSSRRRE